MSRYVSIKLPVKSYVKHFIEDNFSLPVRFYQDKFLMASIKNLLRKKPVSFNLDTFNVDVYSHNITFFINMTDFNRYGCYLDEAGILYINRYFENKIKTLMRSWCASQHAYGLPATICVREFQERFGFTEDIWKAESIYKDCQRNNVFNHDINHQLVNKIHDIILSEMSKNRTITNLALKLYENDK